MHRVKLIFILIVPLLSALLVLLGGRTVTSAPPTNTASEEGPIEIVRHLEGVPTGPLAVQGDHTYAAFGNKLVIIDTSTASLQEVGALYLPEGPDVTDPWGAGSHGPNEIMEIRAQGTRVYLKTIYRLIYIVDVATPSHPTILGKILLNETASSGGSFAVNGRYVYVHVANNDTIDIFDVSNPALPVLLTSFDGFDVFGARMMALDEKLLFVFGRDTVEIVSVEDPAHPISLWQRSDFSFPSPPGTSTAGIEFEGGMLSGDRWYLTVLVSRRSCDIISCIPLPTERYLLVFDTSNPASPELLMEPVSFANDCPTLYYYNVIPQELLMREGYAFLLCPDDNQMMVYDISNPLSPIQVNRSDFQFLSPHDEEPVLRNAVLEAGHLVMVNAGRLRVMDVSVPTAPHELGTYATFGAVGGIVVEGNHAYLVREWGMEIVDVTTLPTPTQVGKYELLEKYIIDMAIRGHYAYLFVAAAGFEPGYGLEVLDISVPSAPTRVGHYLMSTYERPQFYDGEQAYLEIEGDYLYLTWRVFSDNGLENSYSHFALINIQNPSNPTPAGNSLVPPSAEMFYQDIVIEGEYAYLLAGEASAGNSLIILDVSNPIMPTRAGELVIGDVFGGGGDSLVVAGDYAYVVTKSGMLLTIDVSNPLAPSVVDKEDKPSEGETAYSGSLHDMVISGRYLHLVGGAVYEEYQGLQVFDLLNPTNPRLLARERNFIGRRLALWRDVVYIPADSGGLFILRYDAPLSLGSAYATGAPESTFTVAGQGLPANSALQVTVNGRALGSVQSNANGNVTLNLNMTGAQAGDYVVTLVVPGNARSVATPNPIVSTMVRVDPTYPVRALTWQGPAFEVPAGIALTRRLYLPVSVH